MQYPFHDRKRWGGLILAGLCLAGVNPERTQKGASVQRAMQTRQPSEVWAHD